ncbi:hypothetical protein SDRG_05508 [Saprolegnia diclina VS20]|uniref:Armadillo repeat-containing domain-containing protein n=1 Tax=Saprolegnia diclina (strain VS20) TaxID=1156394 RepID=T0QH38_SAPDV|nr:hypothetical protein SDRG_05508 [Saprolegnia diclina VS20]EQC37284.1 hypothetical protein SDRG_05508 [Saprolegnia diclina VS20]|eukprot:XP_008609446.1 hypothetical protein SDRG_05508 [Saprolegnia diclina VS20]
MEHRREVASSELERSNTRGTDLSTPDSRHSDDGLGDDRRDWVHDPVPHLGFTYKGDTFYQRGLYTEALLYLSRLPRRNLKSLAPSISEPSLSARRQSTPSKSKRKVGMAKLTPVRHADESILLADVGGGGGREQKLNRKRQCAAAIDAMAANPVLHPNLFHDNVIPSLLALSRTKDLATSRACVSAMCHLSASAKGRELMLQNGCLSLLQSILSISSDEMLVYNVLATAANLSIEDSFESMFVKEKTLESILAQRKTGEKLERLCSFTLFNLSCPTYTYPRITDVIRALVEHGRVCRDRLLLSQALYNLCVTKSNRVKVIAFPDVFEILNRLVLSATDAAVRSTALSCVHCLAETESCRKPLIVNGTVRAAVTVLRSTTDPDDLHCLFSILDLLALESLGCEEMANVGALSSLAQLSHLISDPSLQTSVYKTISQLVARQANFAHVDAAFFEFLIAYSHTQARTEKHISHYVLHALGCVVGWHSSLDVGDFVEAPMYFTKLLYHVLYALFEEQSVEEYLQAVLLYNMSFNFDALDLAHEAMHRLLYFGLQSPRDDVHALACGTLFNLCAEPRLHSRIYESGVLEVLVRLLPKPSSTCMCLEILCVLFDRQQLSPEAYVALIDATFGAIVKLCDRGDAAVNAGCAACFARFGLIAPCRIRMVQNGLIAALSLLASDDNPETLQLCVSSYSHLSCDPSICRELIEKGIVHSLSSLAAAPEEEVRRACAIAFCNLSTSEDNIVTLVKHGALKALLVISCVKSNDAITRRMCMKAVMNLMRSEVNIPVMCQDGLPWAFTIFAMSSEPQDFSLLADAFCGLSYYKESRRGLAKASTLQCFLGILQRIYDLPCGITMLQGILNLLTDIDVAGPLLHAGLLSALDHLTKTTREDQMHLVAQILTVTFQWSHDVRVKFLDDTVYRMLDVLLHANDVKTKHCCAILLHICSLDDATVHGLLLSDTLLPTMLDTIREGPCVDVMLLLMRTLYNISCRDALLVHMCQGGLVTAIASIVASQEEAPISIAMCAAIMRNLSCEAACHAQLVNAHATSLLVAIFTTRSVTKVAREDAAIGICNLLLGRVNSSIMLGQGALAPILWLSSHAGMESNVLCSAVLRKLAMPPGNIQQLVDEGAVPCIASLLATTTNLYIKRNCIASFCLLARKLSVKPLLATNGVISLTLDLLDDLKRVSDHSGKAPMVLSIERMSVDLVTTLAEFVRPDVPGETHVTSTLLTLLDGDDASGGCEWEQDRDFLLRHEAGPLPLARPSNARQLKTVDVPTLQTGLYPVTAPGFSESFTLVNAERERKAISPRIPTLADAYKSGSEQLDESIGHLKKLLLPPTTTTAAARSAGWKKVALIEFASRKMFSKLRSTFAPMAPPVPLVVAHTEWLESGRPKSDVTVVASSYAVSQHTIAASPMRTTPASGRRRVLSPVHHAASPEGSDGVR